MNENTQEVIAKLEELTQLMDQNAELNAYYEDGAAREALDKIAYIRGCRGAAPKAPSVFKTMPIFPLEQKSLLPLQKDAESKKFLFFGVLGVTALLLIIYFISHISFLNTLSVLGIFASIATGLLYSSRKKQYVAKKKRYDDSVKIYESTMGAFRGGLARFEQEKAAALDELETYKLLHHVSYKDYMETLTAYGENRDRAQAQYQANLKQINDIDLLPEDYLHLAKSVLTILKSGRADHYKEALNLAIDEERQEQEAAARRAAEARRQAEEERRTAIMMQQAAEERRHNEQMERQQAQQAREAAQREEQARRRQEDEARRQTQDAQRREEQARQQQRAAEARTRSAGVSRCANCANSRHCPSHMKNNGSGLNCGGYVPYGGR